MTDKKIGILGLSADPAHLGHIEISRKACVDFGLDEVWWIITPMNPWKKGATKTPFYHRYAIAERLTEDERKWLKVRDFEASLAVERESVRSYTMLKALMSVYPQDEFIFMIGSDNWKHFHQWESWQKIADLVPIAVFNRQDDEETLNTAPAAKYCQQQPAGGPFTPLPQWRLLQAEYQNASSTEIRKAIKQNKGAQFLPTSVIEYIDKYSLYD